MNKFNAIPGFTGSELERAALASHINPVETAFERTIKHKLAAVLRQVASYIDPPIISNAPLRVGEALR